MTDENNTISLSGFITWIRTWIYTKAEINALLSNMSGGVSDYRNYTIVPSDYNPTIDDYIDVTVTVTDMSGNPITNEETSLYIKVPSVASEIRYYDDTDANGQITISNIQMTDWGLIDLRVGSEHCQLLVDGWRQIHSQGSGGTITLYRNKDHARLQFNGHTYNVPTSWGNMGDALMNAVANVRPSRNFVGFNNDYTAVFQINNTTGQVTVKTVGSTALSNKSLIGQIEWAIKASDL